MWTMFNGNKPDLPHAVLSYRYIHIPPEKCVCVCAYVYTCIYMYIYVYVCITLVVSTADISKNFFPLGNQYILNYYYFI